MKPLLRAVFLLVLSISVSACGQSKEPLSALEEIQNQLLNMEGYEATATLTRTSNKGENVYETKQYYQADGKYRLDLTAPQSVAGNYTIYDGERVEQYNAALDKRLVKTVAEPQQPNQLFLGEFMRNYLQSEGVGVEAAALDEAKCVVLEASIPNGDHALASEKLWVDSDTLLPVRLVLYDDKGQERYRIDYEDFTFNPTFGQEIFKIAE